MYIKFYPLAIFEPCERCGCNWLDASGNVRNIRMLETGSAETTAKLVAALRTWKFQPATRGNQPVEVTAILGFNIDTNDRF